MPVRAGSEADVPVGATPTHVAVGEGAILGHERRRRHRLEDRPCDERGRSRRSPSATARAGSPPATAPSGWPTASTAPSRASTPKRTRSCRRSTSATVRSGSSTRPARCGSRTPATARSRGSTPTPVGRPTDRPIAATELAAGAGSLWASERDANRVARIDLSSGDVQPIGVGGGADRHRLRRRRRLGGQQPRRDRVTHRSEHELGRGDDSGCRRRPDRRCRRRARRLGEQRVRRHARADRSADEQSGAANSRRQPAAGRRGRGGNVLVSVDASPAPGTAAGR